MGDSEFMDVRLRPAIGGGGAEPAQGSGPESRAAPAPAGALGTVALIHPEAGPARRRIALLGYGDLPALDQELSQKLLAQGAVPLPGTLDDVLDSASGLWSVALIGREPGEVADALARLRSHPRGLLLGVLVFLRASCPATVGRRPARSLVDPGWTDYADAVLEAGVKPAELASVLSRLARLQAAAESLGPISPRLPPGVRQRLGILQFLATRGVETLAPRREPRARLGHAWPPLDLLAGGDLTGDLDALACAGLLRRSFFDRIHLCPACRDARLAFREVCAGCRSPDVHRGEVLHHYQCGHVAAEELFRQGGALVCPSCDGRLRHVGIDYERPAGLIYCRACALAAGEGVTQARCLACGSVHEADAVLERTIWTYHATEAGTQAAIAGDGRALEDLEP